MSGPMLEKEWAGRPKSHQAAMLLLASIWFVILYIYFIFHIISSFVGLLPPLPHLCITCYFCFFNDVSSGFRTSARSSGGLIATLFGAPSRSTRCQNNGHPAVAHLLPAVLEQFAVVWCGLLLLKGLLSVFALDDGSYWIVPEDARSVPFKFQTIPQSPDIQLQHDATIQLAQASSRRQRPLSFRSWVACGTST